MKVQSLCVLGGTGFVGSHLVKHLANQGHRIKLLTRNREPHKVLGLLPGVTLREADIRDPKTLADQFAGCNAVINLVGILNGSEAEFRAVHAELPRRVAAACQQASVPRLLHMSALNADPEGPSVYLRSKGEGEQAVLATEGLQVTVLRPSIIFGPDDSFFNRFAALLRISPMLPLACPNARFAPVYVGDVVAAFAAALADPATAGQCYELGGPRIYTLLELVQYTARLIGCKRLIVGLSDTWSRRQAKLFERLPGQPFTTDNYLSMQVDSVCWTDGLAALGIESHSVEAIMPRHFQQQPVQRADRYSRFRTLAHRD